MAVLPKSSSPLVTVASWAHSAQQQVTPALSTSRDLVINIFSAIQQILDRYPPLKAFTISLVLFSFVPITIFLGFAGFSGAVVFGVAGTGAAIVQGFVLAFGGFFLFWWLVGALFFAGLATFWFTAGYFGLKTAKKLAA